LKIKIKAAPTGAGAAVQNHAAFSIDLPTYRGGEDEKPTENAMQKKLYSFV
jgi:hypothetical protein